MSGGPIVDNPNYEIIAVQVFDEYGNALEGYKVTWEVVGQGTTTPGTIDTYHPFAHFEDPDYDEPVEGGDDAGVGDLNPYVNSNAWWGDFADGVHPQYAHDANDDDYAWGWTLNQLIDFELDLISAAHVTLVMDETRDELVAMVRNNEADHFTNIVNIKVYTPDGAFMDQFEVTKVWDLDAPTLTTTTLLVGETKSGPWSPALTSAVTELYGLVGALDQYGDPIASSLLKLRITGPFNDTYQGISVGIGPNMLPVFTAAGLHTLWVYEDLNSNGNLDVGEVVSTPATITVP